MKDIAPLMESLSVALEGLNIRPGDRLYVSSDITQLLRMLSKNYDIRTAAERNQALGLLVDQLQATVGPRGTLLFPVFSWAFCRGQGFDCRKTRGETGVLGNWVMDNRSDFLRTRHPMYSFIVWGADAEALARMDNQDAWGASSPFQYLLDNKGKLLLFNIEAWQGDTFLHFVEQSVQVPYRHPKYFFGPYTDFDGRTELRMYSMYVRDLSLDIEPVINCKFLVDNGAACQTDWEKNRLTVIELEKHYALTRNDLLNNRGKNCFLFQNYTLDWKCERTIPYEMSKLPFGES